MSTTAPKFQAPVGKPVRAMITNCDVLETNWRLSDAPNTYRLYANREFAPMPEQGDPLGIIKQLVSLARQGGSGVIEIIVVSHGLTVVFSGAVSRQEQLKLMKTAVLLAGYPVVVRLH